MTADAFNRFHRIRPFQPFAMHLADGRAFDVRHPDAAVPSPAGRTVSVLNPEGLIEVIDVLLVTSLRPLPSSRSRR
jgi:hypothetical protein